MQAPWRRASITQLRPGANFFKSVLDAADLAGANLIGAQFLNCAQLKTTRNWQLAVRDPDLACGAPVPMIADPP
jgi:uncharacterized protein YjbI with pentapeptide repeats